MFHEGYRPTVPENSTTNCINRKFKRSHIQAIKDLVRCAIAQALARSVVKQVHRLIDLILPHLEQVGFLGKELAQQAIVVLVEPTLPRAVRMRKVHLGL